MIALRQLATSLKKVNWQNRLIRQRKNSITIRARGTYVAALDFVLVATLAQKPIASTPAPALGVRWLMSSNSFPRMNWPYVILVALLGTGGLLFIAWSITWQVYREWSNGLPISGGWSWPIVVSVNLVCAFAVSALYWKIYSDAKTTIDEYGIFKPSLFGAHTIAWSEVTNVEVFGGVGYHVHAGNSKIIVTPYAYKNPNQVIEILRINIVRASSDAT
ncbi:hypothetical protein Q2E61_11665 [Microbulbifer thermotolerans]|uniref:hypothetical protein n=1 Tax=Microbulbifer thermotolerans TaxID=252514 RepID=UPI0026737625|nr:hypothetical protein [Microbulbifer thermotolerans]WKT59551.1 hypothetical protein Q2E61_11665 [Microbulbifer thermotolerans]